MSTTTTPPPTGTAIPRELVEEKPPEHPLENNKNGTSTSTTTDSEAQPETGFPAQRLERWNESKTTKFRFFVALFSFVIMGMNDSALGPLLPYIEEYYDISYTVLSVLFLSAFVGYFLAAMANNLVHHHLGQRGVAIIGPIFRILGYLSLAFHPPYPALPVIITFPGFGNGLIDSGWNAWIGNMENANELLGVLHGAYGLGAIICPLIATAMVAKAELEWYTIYYIMSGMAGLDLVLSATAFWTATGAVHRATHQSSTGQERTTTRRVLREPVTWIIALFLIGYVGAEVSLGGWIVTFMLDVRDADPFDAGMTVTGFWLGFTVGRVILGFITGRIGEKLAITGYLLLAIALELMYWFIPKFMASAVIVALLGFVLGPLFPGAIVVATKLLPSDFHVSAIGFAAAFGGGGAAVLPFAVGAIAEHKGVEVLQPIVLTALVYLLIMWWCLPGGLRRGGLERARERNEKVGDTVKDTWKTVVGRIKEH